MALRGISLGATGFGDEFWRGGRPEGVVFGVWDDDVESGVAGSKEIDPGSSRYSANLGMNSF